jgi:hypothetical protein
MSARVAQYVIAEDSMFRRPLVLLLATATLAGCPSAAVQTEGGRAGRPGWIPRPNRSHPNVLYVTGACRDQGAMQQARACALADAQRQIEQQLGQQVTIKGSFVEDEHSERRNAAAGAVRDYWVLVAFPRTELRKEQTRIANRVLLGVSCSSNPDGCCDPRYSERVESAMTEAGMSPAPERLDPQLVRAPVARSLQHAAKQQAARVLLLRLDARFLSSMDGEFYAEARCDYRLIDGVSGKVQTTFESGPVKGGHIAKESSVKKALDNCVAKAIAHLER